MSVLEAIFQLIGTIWNNLFALPFLNLPFTFGGFFIGVLVVALSAWVIKTFIGGKDK